MGERLLFVGLAVAGLWVGWKSVFDAFAKGKMKSIYGDFWERERDGALFWLWVANYSLIGIGGICFLVKAIQP